jgi:hypothetical protein
MLNNASILRLVGEKADRKKNKRPIFFFFFCFSGGAGTAAKERGSVAGEVTEVKITYRHSHADIMIKNT